MISFKQFLKEEAMTSDTHSIVDGLNRTKAAITRGDTHINAKVFNLKDVPALKSHELKAHQRKAVAAQKKGDYYTGSTSEGPQGHYSVEAMAKHAAKQSTVRIPVKGFAEKQTKDWWQDSHENRQRVKKASAKHPILVAKH